MNADQAMCTQIHCSWNHHCLRFLARPAPERQVYAEFGVELCDQFIKVKPEDDVRSKEEAVEAIRVQKDTEELVERIKKMPPLGYPVRRK